MADEIMDEVKECPKCGTLLDSEGACPKDGCGYKRKKKTDSTAVVVQHVDVYEDDWNFTLRETPEGYLIGKAVVTNIGVFEYQNADGSIIRELRPPEEVFRPESMWSLRGKPITNDHPGEAVTVDNIKKYAVGKTEGDPIWDAYYLSIGLVFDDKQTIQDIRKGKRALSCGYSCKLDYTSGVWCGSMYDAIQRDIVYNHLSLVDKGRAGDATRLRIDSAGAYVIHTTKEVPMAEKALRNITIDNAEYQAEDKVIEAYNAERARSDELQGKLDAFIAEKSAIVAEKDSLTEKVASLQKQIDEKKDAVDPSVVDGLVKERLFLIEVAKKADVAVKDSDSNKDIMVAVIKAKAPKASLDGANDVYIQTRFKIVAEDMEVEKQDSATQEVRAIKQNEPATEENKDTIEAKRQAYIEQMKTAWKK